MAFDGRRNSAERGDRLFRGPTVTYDRDARLGVFYGNKN